MATYTIKYDINGGSGTVPASQTKTYGVTLTLRSTSGLSKIGYTCIGWSTVASATTAMYESGGSYIADADATLYAVWQANTYIVILNPRIATVDEQLVSVTYGSPYPALPPPNVSQYAFLGWYLDAKLTIPVLSTTIVETASDHMLYAKYGRLSQVYYNNQTISKIYVGYDKIISAYRGETKIW